MSTLEAAAANLLEEVADLVITRLRDLGLFAPQEWMTAAEVSEYIKFSRKTIYRLTERGELPHRRLEEGLRFNRQEVDAWLNKHREGVEW